MYQRIFTVGCFDFFHYGHQNLFSKMKELGNKIIAGIHDDKSLEKLKNLKSNEHQPLEIRLTNVRKWANQVFVIPSTDPTLYLQCMGIDQETPETACFVRANDMPNFPGKEYVEIHMSIILVPYTQGISSTQIRKELSKK